MYFVQTPPTQITALQKALESLEFSVASDILLRIPFNISLDVLNVIQLSSNKVEYLITFLLELSPPLLQLFIFPLLQLFIFHSHSSSMAP